MARLLDTANLLRLCQAFLIPSPSNPLPLLGESVDRVAGRVRGPRVVAFRRNLARHALRFAVMASMSVVSVPSAGKTINGLTYTYPVERLRVGQSLGNSQCYATLDAKTDLLSDRSSVRFGLRESTNQKYYLLGWDVSLTKQGGAPLTAVRTTFSPASQESELQSADIRVRKKFFLPFENGYLRSAHFLLGAADPTPGQFVIRSHVSFPEGVKIEPADYQGHEFLTAEYPEGAMAVLWGSKSPQSFEVRQAETEENRGETLIPPLRAPAGRPHVELLVEFVWEPVHPDSEYALSFAYSPQGGEAVRTMLLNALFDVGSGGTPSLGDHVGRIHKLLDDSELAIQRYLDAAHLWTPDPVVDRGYAWAKINQLRMQQEYKWGTAFSNNPPTDIVVGRDSAWYLAGSSYYAQPWSRRLLDFWFHYGLQLNGKFIEYMTASQDPIFKDDYGLNINDNTPLLMIAAHRYYSLTGDLHFLRAVYPLLVNSANYILSQRRVGGCNRYGLVWCTSTETFVRGLCGWRNAIRNYNLSGAVTEVNVECFQALRETAELAQAMGDEPNQVRLEAAALQLKQVINQYLRASTPTNPFYLLNINPAGRNIGDMTADLLFPVLCGVSEPVTGRAIMQELFTDRFWAETPEGAGGIRTVSSAQAGYEARATPDNYGLLGGVWPNLALWAGRAAAAQGLPDLTLRALRGTFLLCEPEDPIHCNVVPGEFPEYFNGDDLVQRGMPLSPFVPGIFIWSALEGCLGLSPHPMGVHVNPVLPREWKWMAVSNMPYRGRPLTMLAVPAEHKLYTTIRVESGWDQVVLQPWQEEFSFTSDQPVFWLVIASGRDHTLLAASNVSATGKLIERRTGRVLLEISIPAGRLTRRQLLREGAHLRSVPTEPN